MSSKHKRRPMVGDIVEPLPYDSDAGRGHGPLISGCSRYNDAVVVSVSPFMLVSRGADMLWFATVEREDFIVSGRADDDLFRSCQARIFNTGRLARRARANVRRRNRRDQPMVALLDSGRDVVVRWTQGDRGGTTTGAAARARIDGLYRIPVDGAPWLFRLRGASERRGLPVIESVSEVPTTR